jgi:hypothetical protein
LYFAFLFGFIFRFGFIRLSAFICGPDREKGKKTGKNGKMGKWEKRKDRSMD